MNEITRKYECMWLQPLVLLEWPLKNYKKPIMELNCQLIDAVDNPIPFWATSHRDLGCPWTTLPILDFRILVSMLNAGVDYL
jgi:hypothetical protein